MGIMMKRLAVMAVIATLCSAAALAQHGRAGGRFERGGGVGRQLANPQVDEQSTLLIITAILELTDAQQQQLHAVFDDASKTAVPIAARLRTTRDALFAAAKTPNSDDQIQKLAAQEGSLTTQMATLQAQTFAKMFAMLTNDQKTQVDVTMYNEIGGFLSNPTPPPQPAAPTNPTPGAQRR
jgi:Spy/CpxP family protein refolding chaperone